MRLNLALDSGAHSVFNRFLAAKNAEGKAQKGQHARTHADYSFYDGPQFKKYLDAYIAYCHTHKDKLSFYVTLDVIFNPEKTWHALQYIESCGLHPLPVYHFGEDISWLKRYATKYEHIGVGGLGQDITKTKFIPFGDTVFAALRGSGVKVHGFAMSSFDLMARYPWHSVDSTTASTFARYGAIMVPQPVFKLGQIVSHDFATTPFIFPVAVRRNLAKTHFNARPPTFQACVRHYLSEAHLTFEDVAQSNYEARDIANYWYMHKTERALERYWRERLNDDKHTFKFYPSGNPACPINKESFTEVLNFLERMLGVSEFNYLGTFFQKRPTEYLIGHCDGYSTRQSPATDVAREGDALSRRPTSGQLRRPVIRG